MKIVMISGSRNPNGQTARAANALLDGVTNSGCEVESVLLPALDVERCSQCEDSGWGICRKEGLCIIEDDFESIVKKMRVADALVFATPSYYGDLSESMRAFMDRLRRICVASEGRNGLQDKQVMGICVAGGGGGGALACCLSLEKVLNACGFDVLDMVPVKRQNLKAKLNNLRLNGAWLATAVKMKPSTI